MRSAGDRGRPARFGFRRPGRSGGVFCRTTGYRHRRVFLSFNRLQRRRAPSGGGPRACRHGAVSGTGSGDSFGDGYTEPFRRIHPERPGRRRKGPKNWLGSGEVLFTEPGCPVRILNQPVHGKRRPVTRIPCGLDAREPRRSESPSAACLNYFLPQNPWHPEAWPNWRWKSGLNRRTRWPGFHGQGRGISETNYRLPFGLPGWKGFQGGWQLRAQSAGARSTGTPYVPAGGSLFLRARVMDVARGTGGTTFSGRYSSEWPQRGSPGERGSDSPAVRCSPRFLSAR